MAKIEFITNEAGENIYPVTSMQAVRDENGLSVKDIVEPMKVKTSGITKDEEGTKVDGIFIRGLNEEVNALMGKEFLVIPNSTAWSDIMNAYESGKTLVMEGYTFVRMIYSTFEFTKIDVKDLTSSDDPVDAPIGVPRAESYYISSDNKWHNTSVHLTTKGELSVVESLAKQAQAGVVFNNYAAMVADFNNDASKPFSDVPIIGTPYYIKTLDVPDLWLSDNSKWNAEAPIHYDYVSDEQLIADIKANGGTLIIGWHGVSMLETGKVDLAPYDNTEDWVFTLEDGTEVTKKVRIKA